MPSSVIRHLACDPTRHRLDVQFVSGRRYSYYDVPQDVADAMRKARPKGSYFNRRVRDHFRFTGDE